MRQDSSITEIKGICAFKEHLNPSNAAASVALLFQIFKELMTANESRHLKELRIV